MRKYFYLLMLAAFTYGCGQSGTTATEATKAAGAVALQTLEVNVKGMTCEGCENNVKESVGKVAGVTEVTASFKDEKAVVKFDSTKAKPGQITEAIKSAGYEVVASNIKK